MNSSLSPCDVRSVLDSIASSSGAYKWGVAKCEPTDDSDITMFRRWIDGHYHAEMNYLEKYDSIRHDPRLLLEGAESIIAFAFPYYYPIVFNDDQPRFARYSLSTDYHEVVRERLGNLARNIVDRFGGKTRVCVDTAPLREKYWAVKAGIGFIGRNCQLIIPNAGSYFFLGFILTTRKFPTDMPVKDSCGNCGKCLKACPTGALGSCIDIKAPNLDANKCISYLTIEHRGKLPDNLNLGNRVYGCDTCADVCPHNSNPIITDIVEFIPRKEILTLTANDISNFSPEKFATFFRHSAIKRTKLSGLLRNNGHLTKKS